jgi:hypothetical protein
MNMLFKRLAAHAAAVIRRTADLRRKPAPVPADELAVRRGQERAAHARAAARQARQTAPNDLGNYPGQRQPRPAGGPLAPAERFVRLVAAYLERARTPRDRRPPTAWAVPPAACALYRFAGGGRRYSVNAPTRSEARAFLKRSFGLRTTRGLRAAAA